MISMVGIAHGQVWDAVTTSDRSSTPEHTHGKARKGLLHCADSFGSAGQMDSPKRVSSAATAGGLDIFTHLDNLCQQKGYSSDIRAGSVELLQRLQTSDDHVSPQARATPALGRGSALSALPDGWPTLPPRFPRLTLL